MQTMSKFVLFWRANITALLVLSNPSMPLNRNPNAWWIIRGICLYAAQITRYLCLVVLKGCHLRSGDVFTVNDRVLVIADNEFKGAIGSVLSIHTDLAPEPIYLVAYESDFEGAGGRLFRESELAQLPA